MLAHLSRLIARKTLTCPFKSAHERIQFTSMPERHSSQLYTSVPSGGPCPPVMSIINSSRCR